MWTERHRDDFSRQTRVLLARFAEGGSAGRLPWEWLHGRVSAHAPARSGRGQAACGAGSHPAANMRRGEARPALYSGCTCPRDDAILRALSSPRPSLRCRDITHDLLEGESAEAILLSMEQVVGAFRPCKHLLLEHAKTHAAASVCASDSSGPASCPRAHAARDANA